MGQRLTPEAVASEPLPTSCHPWHGCCNTLGLHGAEPSYTTRHLALPQCHDRSPPHLVTMPLSHTMFARTAACSRHKARTYRHGTHKLQSLMSHAGTDHLQGVAGCTGEHAPSMQ